MTTQVKLSTTVPGNAENRVLFDSFVALSGTILSAVNVARIVFAVKNDQAATIKLYESQDGVTYAQFTADIAVSAAAATALNSYDWFVEPYRYVRVNWVNGATPQGTWDPSMQLESKRMIST